MDGLSSLALQQISRTGETSPMEVVRPTSVANGSSFADTLGQAIKAVDAQQIEADQQSAQLAMGGGNLHETAIALEKADVSMRVATKVRNKLVEAYQEVMKRSI